MNGIFGGPALTVEQLEAMEAGARVRRQSHPDVVYTRIEPAGPNGPWRRYETGVGPVTCRSSTLAMIGVLPVDPTPEVQL